MKQVAVFLLGALITLLLAVPASATQIDVVGQGFILPTEPSTDLDDDGNWNRATQGFDEVVREAKAVREPTTLLLLGIGIIVVAIFTRKIFNS